MTIRRAGGVLVAVLLVLASCGDDDDGNSSAPTTEGSTTSGSEETTTTAQQLPLDQIDVKLTQVGQADTPTSLVTRPGSDTLYVSERAGRVRPMTPDFQLGDPIVDIVDEVVTNSEQGLLDLEFSPDGNTLYLSYNVPPDGDTRIAAYTMNGDTVDPASRRELLAVDQPFPNHKGGDIEIGPDGFLYIGLGDGGAGGDPLQNGQNTNVLLGKILRIDPTQPAGGKQYGIPPGNPFAGGGGAPEVWAYGLRNPWRYTFDPRNDDLWIADVGQDQWEEIDLLPAASGGGAGANLGWNKMEATHSYQGGTNPDGAVLPIFEYSHDDGCSISGGVVYSGTNVPGLTGAYLFTDFCNGSLRAVRAENGALTEQRVFSATGTDLIAFGEDNDANAYVLSLDGGIYRIDPA
ncbi:MAG TPA: PQQ-dependent sugar dehydrogenase [Acidimicrobiales bacterium]|jgi:glucose/arabinose dehydrogenase